MTKNQPYISIVLPTYNRSEIIMDSVNSCLNQTYPYFELIIVDDFSTDNTKEVIDAIDDDRIRYICAEKNGGPGAARNIGLLNAKHDYIAFCDSDDRFHEDKLRIQIEAMLAADEDTGFSYHCFEYTNGSVKGLVTPGKNEDRKGMSGDIYYRLFKKNLVGAPTLLFKKECLKRTGLFDEQFPALEDFDFSLKLAKNYQGLFIDKTLLFCTQTPGSVSNNLNNYLVASCYLINRYKEDLIASDTLNFRLEKLLKEAEVSNLLDKVAPLLEKCLTLPPM